MALDSQHQFGARARRERLALLGLQARDHAVIGRLQARVIRPRACALIDTLFAQLCAHEEAAALCPGGSDLDVLKAQLRDSLCRFGVGFDHAAYFDDRLALGRAFAQRGVPVSVYQGVLARLEALLLARIGQLQCADPAADPGEYAAYADLVVRLGALDLSIGLQAYHDLEWDGWQAQVGRDSLTGLADHGHVITLLEETLARAQAEGRPLCAVMADIDYFKRVNDTYGHLVGDRVLMEVATRIAGALRAEDAVGRYGGEEFLIVLDDASIDTGRRIAQRVCARVATDPIQIDAVRIPLTLSQGVAAAQPGDTAQSLIARADAHLYRAKAAGRNRVDADPTRALTCIAGAAH